MCNARLSQVRLVLLRAQFVRGGRMPALSPSQSAALSPSQSAAGFDPANHSDFGAATHPGVGGGTQRRQATQGGSASADRG